MLKLLIALAISAAIVQHASAETVCRANVIYKWKPGSAGEAKPEEVFVQVLSGRGADEAAAKIALNARVSAALPAAQAACRQTHENLSGCIAAKLQSAASAVSSVSFAGKRAIEEAVTTDCKKLQGACVEAGGEEPVCSSSGSAEAEAAGAAKEEKEKGKKKK